MRETGKKCEKDSCESVEENSCRDEDRGQRSNNLQRFLALVDKDARNVKEKGERGGEKG